MINALIGFAIAVMCFSYAAVSQRRKEKAFEARLRFLEEREDELTKDIASLRGIVRPLQATCAEFERILPPMRSALQTFKTFNETY